jgi:hypothetical protein
VGSSAFTRRDAGIREAPDGVRAFVDTSRRHIAFWESVMNIEVKQELEKLSDAYDEYAELKSQDTGTSTTGCTILTILNEKLRKLAEVLHFWVGIM